MIQQYMKSGNVNGAMHVFINMKQKGIHPNVVTYNIMMDAFSKTGNADMVHRLFKGMIDSGIKPRDNEFTTVIRACAINADVTRAVDLFDSMEQHHHLHPGTWSYNAMLHVCATAGQLSLAKKYFARMESIGIQKDVVTYTSLIVAYAEATDRRHGHLHLNECRHLLEEMEAEAVRPNICTFNALIRVCVRGALMHQALELLSEIEAMNIRPTVITYDTLLDGLAKDTTISKEKAVALLDWILDEMARKRVDVDSMIYSTLLNVCCKVGDLKKAEGFFRELKESGLKPDVVCYGSMIKCYQQLGDLSNKETYLQPCFKLLEEMERRRIPFNVELYASVINSCANAGDVDGAVQLWKTIQEKGVVASALPFSAIIKACLWVNDVQGAFGYLDQMESIGIIRNQAICHMFLRYFSVRNKKTEALQFLLEMRKLKVKVNATIQKELDNIGNSDAL